jgi:hypothetical protein
MSSVRLEEKPHLSSEVLASCVCTSHENSKYSESNLTQCCFVHITHEVVKYSDWSTDVRSSNGTWGFHGDEDSHWYPTTSLHGVLTQKTTAQRSSRPTPASSTVSQALFSDKNNAMKYSSSSSSLSSVTPDWSVSSCLITLNMFSDSFCIHYIHVFLPLTLVILDTIYHWFSF